MATLKTRQPKKTKLSIGYRQSALNGWQYSNKSALDIINEYQKKIQNGDWLSSEDRTTYKNAIDTYTSTGNKLREASKHYGQKYTADEEKSWTDSLSSLQSGYSSVNDFYNQFADDIEYGKWYDYNTKLTNYNNLTGASDYAENSKYIKGVADNRYNFINQSKGWGFANPFSYAANGNDTGKAQLTDFLAFPEAIASWNKGDAEMTDEQIGIYNYLYASEGKEKADEYLDFIADTVMQQKVDASYKNFKLADTLFDITTHTNNLGEYIYGFGSGVDTGLSGFYNAGALVEGKKGFTPASQYVSSQIRQELGGENGELTLEQVFYDLANTTGNMAPSIGIGALTTPLGGAVAMGLSSAGNNYASMIDQGYDVNTARAYGIMTGVAEAGMSYAFSGIGKLGGKLTGKAISKFTSGINNAILRIAGNVVGNVASEALEEATQTILDPVFKWAATLGDEEMEAIDWGEVGYSALLGGLSAGLLESGPSLVNTGVQSHQAYTNAGGATLGGTIKAAIDPNINFSDYVSQGAKNVTNTAGAYANAVAEVDPNNKAAKYVQNQIKSGKNVSGYQINRLATELDTAITNHDRGAIKSSVETRLNELGEKENVSKLADVLTKQAMGEKLSLGEKNILNKSTYGEWVSSELDPESVNRGFDGEYSDFAESIGTKRVNAEAYNRQTKAETANATPESASAVEAKKTASKEVSAPKVTVKNAEGKAVNSTISGIEVDGGKATFTLANGEKVSADKATFQTDLQKLVADIAVEKVSRVEGFSTEAATAMVKGYDGKMDVSDYNAAINDAYRYGYQGISINEISLGKNTSLVADKAPLYVAYDAGKQYAKSNFTRPSILGVKKSGTFGTVSIAKDIDQTKLTEAQKTQIKALEVVAGGLGVNVRLFSSPVDENGQHIGENGRYNAQTRSLDIDLNSGATGNGIMLNTAAHEVTHHIKTVASDKFKAFADAVFEEFNNKGVSVDALIEQRVEKMRGNKVFAEFTEAQLYDRAYEEVVADAAESMLTDSDALVKLANKIKAKDHSLWESIKDFFKGLVKKIKELYKNINPDSLEGSLVRDMGAAAERLQKLWVEGVMAASEVDLTQTISEETMTVIDAESESVSPVMFSERTWTASEYVTAREEMAKKIANALGVSVNKAKKYIDDVNSIAKLIANDRARLDYEASSFGSAFVSNVEYGGSFDYTTLCKKRRIYTGTFTEIQKRLRNTALTPDDILKIRNLLIDEGVEATCGLCYVEGSRANMGKFSQKFIELYKRDFPDAWIPDMADVNTPDGVEKMRIKHPEVYERYEYFWNHYGKLQDSDPALFASQQKPKLYEARKEYKGEILTQFKKDSSIEKKNLNGGIRMQSFSDFEIVHLIDTMQVIMDMSTVGLAGQAYTKVPEFAKAFGNTGLKINLSLIAKGVDADGRLIFDDREGMPHETAFELRNKYSKDVGTIIVTFTDEQLMAAMADERIDFIIPFHRSQWKKGQYGAMGLPKGTKDYTFMQNEKLIRQTYHEYQGRLVKDKATNYMPNEYWDFSKSGKENAEAYLKMCAENNKRPKFYKLLDHDGDGTYTLKADGSTDGYWKLLVDFKMYDNNGVGSPQAQVVPNFNMEESYKMLKEYEGGHAQYPVAQGVVDKFVSEYEKNNEVKYSERISLEESFSNRALLANALEGVTQNAAEKENLQKYKKEIDGLNEQERKLFAIREKIKEIKYQKSLTYDGKKLSIRDFEEMAYDIAQARGVPAKNVTFTTVRGQGNTGRYNAYVNTEQVLSAEKTFKSEEKTNELKKLQEEERVLETKINNYDQVLLKLEATKPLKDLVQREKANAYKAAAEKGREALHRNVEGRHKTAEKQAIRGIAKELEKLRNRGTKERNVKKGERDLVAKVLELTDMLYASDDELLLNGIGTEFTEAEAEAMDDYMALYDQYHSYDNAVTANKEKRAELRQQMAEVKKQFEGVLERERKRISEANASGIFDAIIKEYESLNKSEEAYIKQAYKPEVAEYLKQMKDTIGNANLSDMSLEQLETLHKAMSLIKHLIQDSNKLFRNGKTESIETRREAIFIAIDALKNRFDKDYPEIIGKALDKINELGWNNLRPVDAFELTDANALIELYWDVISAQNTYARDVEEAKAALIKARESHGYAKWNLDDVTTFETEDGRNFNVTLGEMMSIYAYSKRDQADKHMREGGFQHEKKAIYKEKGIYKLRKKEALTYKVNDKMRLDIINSLTKEQRAYVDEVQKVLTDWGEKGNEASRIIYGIDLFTEKVYFPLQSATDYLSSASTELGKTVTTASLSATGMAKATIPGASNPIILRGFDEVVLEHFDKMAKYHSYLVPIDNLRKMLDAQGKDNNNNIVSTKALIGSKLGDGASKYFQDYITDLNGGMNIGGAKNPLESFFGKSKAMSVMANISVWVQQYFSIVRAFSEVNPKYFIPFMGESFKKADMKLYAEMKKYAPITTIKEMGGFDVGSNRTIQDYVGYEGTGKAKGKAWKKFQDMLGVGAEAMDKLGWMTIWKGVKKEVAASGKYKTGSEEYFKACGERFERIIAKTQVYDSVNSKSAYMRSKNPAVKYLVSFMGEPTTILGMAEVSIIKFERAVETGDKAKIKEAGGKLAGTMAAISVSTALTSVAKSLVYALRDDDEDETYLEKYAQSLGKAFADDINIFKYIPVARDIVSAWEGFTTERPDMTLLQDVIDSVKKVINKLNDEDSTTEEIFSGYMNAALAIGNIFGIPAKNVYRDIKGLITTIANIGNGYRTDFGEKLAEGFLDTSKNKSQKLYDAIVSGDENLAKYYQSTYKDFSAYKTALRKTLRENDERIKEAAEAKNSGDIETYESILQEIIDEGNFDSVIIEEAIDAEADSYYSDMKSDDMRIIEAVMATISGDNNKRIEIEKALVEEGRFTVDLINKARRAEMNSLNSMLKEAKELTARGRYSDAEAIYNDLINKGYTKEFIEAQKNKK